jgi:hypothetical protein
MQRDQLGGNTMAFTSDIRSAYSLFHPYALRQTEEYERSGRPFAYYTTSGTAVKIIQGKEFWMRQASRMSDSSETEYGLNCLRVAYAGQEGQRLRTSVDSIYPGLMAHVEQVFDRFTPELRSQTFLTCISEHGDEWGQEDRNGRLSMWRAYGSHNGHAGVALVLNPTPFFAPTTSSLGIVASPVAYFRLDRFVREIKGINDGFGLHKDYFAKLGRVVALDSVYRMFMYAAICAKHPGFHEEREWRIICTPHIIPPNGLYSGTFNGEPIYQIPMRTFGDVKGVDLPEFILKAIVGPGIDQDGVRANLIAAFAGSGVSNGADRVVLSDIPFRYLERL